jgi:hypothetical protein
MIMFDQLMYVRAWNSFVSLLGEQALAMLRADVHPLETLRYIRYIWEGGLLENSEAKARISKAIRTFWRLTAFYYGNSSYRDLIARLGANETFREAWNELAVAPDTSEIDTSGVATLLLPASPRWDLTPSLVVLPPVYTLIEFVPGDDESTAALQSARERFDLTVEFSSRDHWTQPYSGPEPTVQEDPLPAQPAKPGSLFLVSERGARAR